jgi:phospholipid transport system substrate-binding protein
MVWALPAAAESGPRDLVEQANQQIQKLVNQVHAEGSPGATERDRQLKTVVTELLDIDFMAQEALGRTWESLSPEQRQEYLSLMRQLVERSYLRQTRSRIDYTVEIGDVDINERRGQAEVQTRLRITTRGRVEMIEIVYGLERRENRWRVVDVETDGLSMVSNYRSQFRRIIRQDGVPELLNRMRSRLQAGETDL